MAVIRIPDNVFGLTNIDDRVCVVDEWCQANIGKSGEGWRWICNYERVAMLCIDNNEDAVLFKLAIGEWK